MSFLQGYRSGGEPVKNAPAGNNKYLWFLLDASKARNVDTESFGYKIYDLWKQQKTDKDKDAAIPDIPRSTLTVRKRQIKLTPSEYEQYQSYVGKNRAALAQKYAQSPSWEKDSNDQKLETLSKIYRLAAKNAKNRFLREHPELFKR